MEKWVTLHWIQGGLLQSSDCCMYTVALGEGKDYGNASASDLPMPCPLLNSSHTPTSQEIADMIVGGRIGQPTIDSVHAFTAEGREAAYARLKSRRAKGKVVVQVSGNQQVEQQ